MSSKFDVRVGRAGTVQVGDHNVQTVVRGDARSDAAPEAPRTPSSADRTAPASTPRFDAFLCHASEDKSEFVRPLYDALTTEGLAIWYDEEQITLGDSLSRAIDAGLAQARFGVVVLSHAFFRKRWPVHELSGLVARELGDGRKCILPIWYGIGHGDVLRYSAPLADRAACQSPPASLGRVVEEIVKVVRPGPKVPAGDPHAAAATDEGAAREAVWTGITCSRCGRPTMGSGGAPNVCGTCGYTSALD